MNNRYLLDGVDLKMVESPAGFWIRLGALLLDGLIIGIPALIIALLLGFTKGQQDTFVNLIELAYTIFIPLSWSGYTIGKKICGIRIVKVNGRELTFGTMLLRQLVGSLIDSFTLGIAVIVSAFMVGLRKDKRAIHDLIAGTYVTHRKPY